MCPSSTARFSMSGTLRQRDPRLTAVTLHMGVMKRTNPEFLTTSTAKAEKDGSITVRLSKRRVLPMSRRHCDHSRMLGKQRRNFGWAGAF